MKKSIFSVLSLVMTVFVLMSCDDTFTDLMTADVKTGGILTPTSSIPYKLGGMPNFKVTLEIPKGPGIEAVEVYRTFTGKGEVLDRTVEINSDNAVEDITVDMTYTYPQMIVGLNMPTNESLLAIGDAWTLRYVSVMEDGRKVNVSSKTKVTVANKYAGWYQCVGVFSHPTAGDRPINEKKFLTPIDANSCWGNAGDLGSAGYFVKVTVNPADNTVTCSTWDEIEMSNIAGEPNYYDPATGKFHLAYFYVAASGPRLMREVWTPIP